MQSTQSMGLAAPTAMYAKYQHQAKLSQFGYVCSYTGCGWWAEHDILTSSCQTLFGWMRQNKMKYRLIIPKQVNAAAPPPPPCNKTKEDLAIELSASGNVLSPNMFKFKNLQEMVPVLSCCKRLSPKKYQTSQAGWGQGAGRVASGAMGVRVDWCLLFRWIHKYIEI